MIKQTVVIIFAIIPCFAFVTLIGDDITFYDDVFIGEVYSCQKLNKPKMHIDTANVKDSQYVNIVRKIDNKILQNQDDVEIIRIKIDTIMKGRMSKDSFELYINISKGWWFTSEHSDSISYHDWTPRFENAKGLFGIYHENKMPKRLLFIDMNNNNYEICKKEIREAFRGENRNHNYKCECYSYNAIIAECKNKEALTTR